MNKPEIPLGRLISILSLVGASLFFVGWIYRWAYFSFFQVQITALNLPPQSFLFIPLQVFFGDSHRILITILSLTVAAIAIYALLWLFNLLLSKISTTLTQWELKLTPPNPPPTPKKTLKSYLKRFILSFLRFNKTKTDSFALLRSLVEELIPVLLIVLLLYWSARTQGINDARRDASPKSTLPVITLINKENQIPLGGKLDDPFAVPTIKGFSIIGDRGMFKSLQDRVDTDITDSKNPRVWRLLIEQGSWFYLFYNLPANAPQDQRPLVLALKESQMLILSPEPTKP